MPLCPKWLVSRVRGLQTGVDIMAQLLVEEIKLFLKKVL